MADYGQFEITRQGAQPAELYKFFWGNQSVAGTSAGTPTATTSTETCVDTVATGATVLARDSFTGSADSTIDGTALDGGGDGSLTGTWTHVAPSATTIKRSGGYAVRTGTFSADAHYIVQDVTANDYTVTVKGSFPVAAPDGSYFEALARYSSAAADTGYVLSLINEGANLGLYLYKETAGAFTLITGRSGVLLPAVGTGTHTLTFGVTGNALIGGIDGDNFIFVNDTTFATGAPGLSMDDATEVGSLVRVSDWYVTDGPAQLTNPCADFALSSGYTRDAFTGSNDQNIDGRVPDGEDLSCLAQGSWNDTLPARANSFDISSGTCRMTSQGASLSLWKHYTVEGIPDLGDDYKVSLDFTLIGRNTTDTWVSLLLRHSDTNETGYECVAELIPDGTYGAGTPGGIEYRMYSVSAGAYTEIKFVPDYRGEINLSVQHTFSFQVVGSTLCGAMDGTTVISMTDTTYPSGGAPGMCLLDGSGTGSWLEVTRWSVCAGAANKPCPDDATTGLTAALLTLNYTTADVPITYEGEVYEPMIGHRTPFRLGTGERSAAEIDLSIPMDHPVATLVETGLPRAPIGVIVYRLDRQDLTDGAAAIPLQGQVTKHRIEGRWCILTLGNVGTLLTRKLPRMLTQRSCPHVLYGPFCQKSSAGFTVTGLTVNAIQGRIINIVGATTVGDPTYFEQGVLVTSTGLREFIELQSGDSLTLKQVVPGLEEGDTVSLIAGCDHLASTCDTRFTNILHFGGEIGIQSNPATGAGLVSAVTTPGEA